MAISISCYYYHTKYWMKKICITVLKFMNNVKEINVKNGTYCYFNSMINIKNLDPNKIKVYEKPFKNVLM